MDIRDWPLDQIMQLPDCCFGRRFIVACAFHVTEPGRSYDISEIAFPEYCVIWGFSVWAGAVTTLDARLRLVLGDHVPVLAAEFDVMEPLFNGVGVVGVGPRDIWVGPGLCVNIGTLRKLIHPMGRRLVVEFLNGPGDIDVVRIELVVSSIPKEVPDWLISGHLKSP